VAVVLAITFVASPFYLRQAVATFSEVDGDLTDVARTLGARRRGRSGRVVLPLAFSGLVAGWVLAFARGVGEFGATIIFAGNVQGRTTTLTLAVYQELDSSLDVALALGVLLVALSATVLLSYKLLGAWRSSTSTITSELRSFRLALRLAVGDEVVALVGPSGAGKTTVLRAVAGLHRPDHGRIACDGQSWFERERSVDLAPERAVGRLRPQHHALFPHLTVRQNVAFSGADGATVDSLLERLGIARLAGERPARLSGGERQRTALARALARAPEVLLLDEPLAALDAHTRRVVRDELATELRGLGIPTLLVTHDFADASAPGRPRRGDRRRHAAPARHAGRAARRAGRPLRRRVDGRQRRAAADSMTGARI